MPGRLLVTSALPSREPVRPGDVMLLADAVLRPDAAESAPSSYRSDARTPLRVVRSGLVARFTDRWRWPIRLMPVWACATLLAYLALPTLFACLALLGVD